MGSDFFVPARSFTAAEVAELTGATLLDPGCSDRVIDSLASAGEATAGSLAFVDGRKNAHLLSGLAATAVLCPEALKDLAPAMVAVLVHKNPSLAFARVARAMFPEAAFPVGATGEQGISSSASIHPTAILEEGVVVEAGAVIGADVVVGSGTTISANAVLGPRVRVGRNSFIGPNASIRYTLIGDKVIVHAGASIGRDGFGFALGERGLEHVPQLGRVILQNDVEIGANSAVDRGALGDTIIGEGAKIDNLVQIGHNTKVGRHSVIAGHCGIAGSVTIGDFVMIGGGVGIADHVKIGARAQIAGGSGIMEDIPDGERWAGYPAVPFRQFFRQFAFLRDVANEKKAKPDG